ncbi:glycosyltransferase [Mariniflexile litorale]|uniref:Glycosyltransferase n=1 Tax=Mariniflexile litorale TaxID=3045158 RepID=A0AAU7EBY1_9FLAO|nr:glycosyltransferase [Mariniflexile sp. KMM 9835]MDQ8210412.1 glycosyltransferase [Mariniflexile sp. KMM 9835]
MNKRICLLTDSLGSGGAEKMVSNLSISLSKKGYVVTVVSMLDIIVYPYKGTLYNFGKVKNNNKLKSFLKFKAFFKTQQFDVILDHRIRLNFIKEFIFSKVIFKNENIIYCVHHFNLGLYFPLVNVPWISRSTLVKNREIVAVSKEIQNKIKQQLHLESHVIYNYVLLDNIEANNDLEIPNSYNYIIGVGRLTSVKQFDVLIKSYKNSELINHDIKLLISGEGIEKTNLNKLIIDLNLNDFVKLIGFKSNVLAYIKKAMALVLASKSEGFPMVLIEALTLKTPVVSFNCKSGPAEIIKNEENGLLVDNQNSDMLTESLNKLLLNDTFYNKIKSNLSLSSNPFSEENNIQKWINLLHKFN